MSVSDAYRDRTVRYRLRILAGATIGTDPYEFPHTVSIRLGVNRYSGTSSCWIYPHAYPNRDSNDHILRGVA